jgi:cellulose synthase/poly-beta-1,6-N-acetylglucosamine synthase-like glycosyltransferase
MMEIFQSLFFGFLGYFTYFAVGYFVVLNFFYLMLIVLSFFHIRKQIQEKDVYGLHGLFASNLYNPISILAPAFNEEATVIASVKSLLQLRFPNYEVIVINDGSSDRTMDVLKNEFKLKRIKRYVPLVLSHKPIKAIYKSQIYPELIVVDKENGRKADALNAGINVCRNDLFCAIDADCVLEPDVLQNMLRCFIEDDKTIAVGGIVRVANDCVIEGNEIKEIRIPKSHLARIQVVEYLRAFLFGRVGWDFLDSLLIISGAFGIFDRNAVLKVGGYLHDTVGEDMELVVRLHRYHRENKLPYRVRFLPEPVCWTEVPEDINVLARQRNRWHRGLADTLWRHRRMLFNPKYGRLGFVAMPFYLFFELLSPIIELFGYLIVILLVISVGVNSAFAAVFLAAAIMLGMVLSVASVLCEEFTFRRYPKFKDLMIITVYAFLENFGFRQMHAWWRFRGLIDFARGNKEWGAMNRKGFGTPVAIQNLPKSTDTDQPSQTLAISTEEASSESIGIPAPASPYVEAEASVKYRDIAAYESDEMRAIEAQNSPDNEKHQLITRIFLALFVAAVLVVSLWWKISNLGQFTDGREAFSGTVELSDETLFTPADSLHGPSDYEHTLEGSRVPEIITIPTIPWNNQYFYAITYHSFFSDWRAVYTRNELNRLVSTGVAAFAEPRIGTKGTIIWTISVGEYPTYRLAMRDVPNLQEAPADFTVTRVNDQDMRVFEQHLDFDPDGPLYRIVLAMSGSKAAQKLLMESWQEAGFNTLHAEPELPFRIFAGYFNDRVEAELMAAVVARKSALPIGVYRVR